MSLLARKKKLLMAARGFSPFVEDFTSGVHLISVPVGAVQVIIECIGRGGAGLYTSGTGRGGGGAGYSRRTWTNFAGDGITAFHLSLPATVASATVVRRNSDLGTITCQANSGGNATTSAFGSGATAGFGDVARTGGNGSGSGSSGAGGGAGGPSGNGGNSSGGVPGSGGGAPGGDGGSGASVQGEDYGGGGGCNQFGNGTGGLPLIRLSWS